MNREERRALRRLPKSIHPWEVGLVRPSFADEQDGVEGLLFVAESPSGRMRHVGPVEEGGDLLEALAPALDEPEASCVPARPSKLLVTDPVLGRRLKKALGSMKVRIEVVARLPAVEEASGVLEGPMELLDLDDDDSVYGPDLLDDPEEHTVGFVLFWEGTLEEELALAFVYPEHGASRVVRRLDGVDELRVVPSGGGVRVVACRRGEVRGTLMNLKHTQFVDELLDFDDLHLCVAVGEGLQPPRPSEVVMMEPVRVTSELG